MINRFVKYGFFFLMLSWIISCRHAYNPPAIQSNDRLLVVSGFINTGQNVVTTINLARSQNLSDSTATANPEPHAQISIEAQNGNSYALHELGNGNYSSDSLNLDYSTDYRLRIITSDGKNYLSDFVQAKQTPAIDSVSWEQKVNAFTNSNDVTIFVNTHDPQNNTLYYHWDFIETWEYKSTLSTPYGLEGNNIIIKDKSTETDSCWHTANSNIINVGTSVALKSDVISHQPITTILQNDERISVRYSILVQQYALSKDAYQFRLNLQNNTQLMGSIFDPQPSQLSGNIHCVTNPNEPVIGYLSASSVEVKRIFIAKNDVADWKYPGIPTECKSKYADQNPGSYLNFNYSDTTYYPYYFSSGALIVAKVFCLDCRWWGGTTKRPSFW